jgi:cell division protein FtsL
MRQISLKLLLVLWLLLISSAIAVVYSTHSARILFNQNETLKDQAYQLDVEWNQLLLEQSAVASYGRIEYAAGEKLGMEVPKNKDLVLVTK